MDGAYNGTQGSVDVETSIQRLTPNLEQVYDTVADNGTYGMTWKELAFYLDLHHGQASGALSNLHKQGFVFTVRDFVRDRCQVYVVDQWRKSWADSERFDEPVKTKSTRQAEAGHDLAQAVYFFLRRDVSEITNESLAKLRSAYLNYKENIPE